MRQLFACQLLVLTVIAGAARPEATVALAGQQDAIKAFGIDEKAGGKTCEQWSAEWWKWALSFKKDRNPVTDKTGEFAAIGQPKEVWFLAGNFGGVSKRKCSIPADRPILVPVFNYFASQHTKKREEGELTKYAKAMAAEAKEVIDRGDSLSLQVNGKALNGLEKRRYVSTLFEVTAPNLLEAVHPSFAGKQTGVSDGYWVMLQPLPEGKHTLRIQCKLKAKQGEAAFAMDVTYEITVQPKQ